jgi:hypothetical protein
VFDVPNNEEETDVVRESIPVRFERWPNKNGRTLFFHFLLPPKLPSMDDMDEDEADRLEEAFDADYDVAQAFRLHIVPKAVLWFMGQGDAAEMQMVMIEADDVEELEEAME